MNELIFTIAATELDHADLHNKAAIESLELGKIIYLPQLSFKPNNLNLCNPVVCDTKKKNISYDYRSQTITGISADNRYHSDLLTMMPAYAQYAQKLVNALFPEYQSSLRWGRTSFRPTGINNRQLSKRQDDTRLHVDAFPSSPVQGWRILRVFCNINPHNKPRVWQVGDEFSNILQTFFPKFTPYRKHIATLLKFMRITKSLRTDYDHYMLQLHDRMKLDDYFQATTAKTTLEFAANSSWIVFSDQVSHAALGGQYLLEQTFYLPITAMCHPDLSPFRQMQQLGLVNARNTDLSVLA